MNAQKPTTRKSVVVATLRSAFVCDFDAGERVPARRENPGCPESLLGLPCPCRVTDWFASVPGRCGF